MSSLQTWYHFSYDTIADTASAEVRITTDSGTLVFPLAVVSKDRVEPGVPSNSVTFAILPGHIAWSAIGIKEYPREKPISAVCVPDSSLDALFKVLGVTILQKALPALADGDSTVVGQKGEVVTETNPFSRQLYGVEIADDVPPEAASELLLEHPAVYNAIPPVIRVHLRSGPCDWRVDEENDLY